MLMSLQVELVLHTCPSRTLFPTSSSRVHPGRQTLLPTGCLHHQLTVSVGGVKQAPDHQLSQVELSLLGFVEQGKRLVSISEASCTAS